MEQFGPLLMIMIFWAIIGIPAAIAKKAAEQKKQAARPAAQKAQKTKAEPVKEQKAEPRLKALTPTVSFTGHDDSVYQGSLNAFTGEGYDPCHDEQMLPLTQIESEPEALPQQVRGGLPLGWTDNDIVRGIVMSEILNRKKH